MSDPVTLYTYALSPYGMKVYWSLIYKQVPFALQYVSPRDQQEIAFTRQRVVPVLQMGDDWRLDSGSICCWLDEVFPNREIAGCDDGSRHAIREADDWVTRNVIALSFRSIIDDDQPRSAFRNGRKLANVMRRTSGGIPWWAQFFWTQGLRGTAFVVRDASQLDRSVSIESCRRTILAEFERRVERTGYLAATETPSYADIALFAQLVCNTTFGLEGALASTSSKMLTAYYERLCAQLPLEGVPPLVPGWRPVGCT